jgi:excisionase family DNA binding protein
MTPQKPLLIPRLLSIAEVARHLGVSKKTIRRLVEDGRLRSYRVRRQIRISEEDLTAYATSRAGSAGS